MFKFVNKKHISKNRPEAKFVIYYSVSDIILGVLLMGLSGFFAVSYVQDHIWATPAVAPASISPAVIPKTPSSVTSTKTPAPKAVKK